MRCTACHRKLSATPLMVGRYAYGPVCFNKMFPSTKRVKTSRVDVVIDDQTPDLFGCYFDTMGALHAQQLGARA